MGSFTRQVNAFVVTLLSSCRHRGNYQNPPDCSCAGDGLQLANHPEQPPGRYIAVLATVA